MSMLWNNNLVNDIKAMQGKMYVPQESCPKNKDEFAFGARRTSVCLNLNNLWELSRIQKLLPVDVVLIALHGNAHQFGWKLVDNEQELDHLHSLEQVLNPEVFLDHQSSAIVLPQKIFAAPNDELCYRSLVFSPDASQLYLSFVPNISGKGYCNNTKVYDCAKENGSLKCERHVSGPNLDIQELVPMSLFGDFRSHFGTLGRYEFTEVLIFPSPDVMFVKLDVSHFYENTEQNKNTERLSRVYKFEGTGLATAPTPLKQATAKSGTPLSMYKDTREAAEECKRESGGKCEIGVFATGVQDTLFLIPAAVTDLMKLFD